MESTNQTPSRFTMGGVEPVATRSSVEDRESGATDKDMGIGLKVEQEPHKGFLPRLSAALELFTSQASNIGWSHPVGSMGNGESAGNAERHHEGHNIIHDEDDHEHLDHNLIDDCGSDNYVDFGDNDHCGDSHDHD